LADVSRDIVILAWLVRQTAIRSSALIASRSSWFDVDGDVPPFPLPEPQYAQHGAGEMAENDGEPDVARL